VYLLMITSLVYHHMGLLELLQINLKKSKNDDFLQLFIGLFVYNTNIKIWRSD